MHLIREDSRQIVLSDSDTPDSFMTDHEAKGNGRRRTPVACLRCRKRKIKCSGDAGDSQGCTNCRASGTTNCTFLRVNSSMLHTRSPYLSLPYPNLNSSGALSAGGMQPSFQEQHTLPQTTSHTLHSAPANCSPCALLHSAFDCGTANGNSLSNRSPYIQGYQMSYDEDANYSMSQSQPAMLVTGDMPDGGAFDSPAPTKAWYDSSQIKPLQGSFPDSDANNTLATSSYPFLLQQSAATDNVSVFPLMNPLSASLTSDRTLPTPAGLRNNTFPPSASVSENLNTFQGNIPNLKSAWGLDKHFLSDFSIPRGSSSAGSSTTSLERCKPPASPPDLGFGYIPISSHARGPAVTSPCTFADTIAFSDRFRTASEPKCSKASLREKIPDFYTSEVYGYERCRGSRGNLVSGDIYIRNPADSEPISIVRPDSIRRPTPIPALNNI